MTSKAFVSEFIACRKLALVGASRGGKKFGNTVLRELRTKGYELFPVHPHASEIDGVRCCASLSELPTGIEGVILVVQPAQAEELVREAAAVGIHRVWLQQGAQSPAALAACRELGVSAVSDECILMFAEPAAWYHRFHRWLWGILGKLPS